MIIDTKKFKGREIRVNLEQGKRIEIYLGVGGITIDAWQYDNHLSQTWRSYQAIKTGKINPLNIG